MLQISTPEGLNGIEREVADRTAILAPDLARVPSYPAPGNSPHSIFLTLPLLRDPARDSQRDLTAASSAPLIPTSPTPVADAFRDGIAVRAGCQFVDGLTGNVPVPATSATSTVAWLTSEAGSTSPSTPTLAVTPAIMVPHIAVGCINLSPQFLRQAENADAFVARELTNTGAALIDAAMLNGPGSSGAPKGVNNMTGVGSQSGTSLAWSGLLAMKANAATANAQDGTISFIGTPAVRQLLEARERASGNGGFIWQDNAIASCRAFASTSMPSGTLLCGPFGSVVIGFWGLGLTVDSDPYTNFQSGIVTFRIILAVDIALRCAASAFTKSSSIT
jgi:HK97 family phage major capsid protein